MLVITAELWPSGDRKNKTLLGVLMIVNDGTGQKTIGNYDATVSRKPARHIPIREQQSIIWKQAKVKRFRRARFGVWYLVIQALKAMSFDHPEAIAPTPEKPS